MFNDKEAGGDIVEEESVETQSENLPKDKQDNELEDKNQEDQNQSGANTFLETYGMAAKQPSITQR